MPMTLDTVGTLTQSEIFGNSQKQLRISLSYAHGTMVLWHSFSCNTKPNETNPECTDDQRDTYESPAYCGMLLDSKGPFAICHPRVSPNVSNCRTFTITKCWFPWWLFSWGNSMLNCLVKCRVESKRLSSYEAAGSFSKLTVLLV